MRKVREVGALNIGEAAIVIYSSKNDSCIHFHLQQDSSSRL